MLLSATGVALFGAPPSEVETVGLAKLPPPYFEPDSTLCTWSEARRLCNYIFLPEYHQFWNTILGEDALGAPHPRDLIREKYIDLPPERLKLISLGLEMPSLDEYLQVFTFEWRLDDYIFVDRETNRLVLSGPIHNISPELAQSVDEDLVWLNGVIDWFLADGYTPENIMRRLWDENVYLNFSDTFMKLFHGAFQCWPLAAMRKMAHMRVVQSDEYRNALKSHVSGKFVDLGDKIDSKAYAAKLNMTEGFLYEGLRDYWREHYCSYVSTRQGKLRFPGLNPNVLRNVPVLQYGMQKTIYQYPIRYLDQHGVITWVGEAADWKDLKPPVDPGDL